MQLEPFHEIVYLCPLDMKHYLLGLTLFFCTLLAADEELFHGVDILTGKIVLLEEGFIPEFQAERVAALNSIRDLRTAFTFVYLEDCTAVEDADGRHYCFMHDGAHLASKKIWDSDGTLFAHESYTWENDLIISQSHFSSDGTLFHQKTVKRDDNSILTTQQTASGVFWEKAEYEGAKLILKTDSEGHSTRYTYNTNGLLVAEIKNDPQETLRQFYFYDEQGFLNEYVTDNGIGSEPSDLNGLTERKRIEIIPSILQPEIIILYRYNPDLGLEIVEKRIEGVYNTENKLIFEDFFDSKENESAETYFDYDSLGHLTLLHDGLGNGIESSYDEEHHLLRQTILAKHSPVESSIYTYEATQHPASQETMNASGETTPSLYLYNPLNQIIATIDAIGNRTDYAYNPLGQLTTIIHPAVLNENECIVRPTQKWLYDSLGKFIAYTDPRGDVHNSQAPSPIHLSNPWTPSAFSLKLPENPHNATVQIFTDKAGSSSRKITIAEDCDIQTTYICDALNRVVEIQTISIQNGPVRTEKMFYDPAGNPLVYSWFNSATQQWTSSAWTIGYRGKIDSFIEAASTPLQRITTYLYDDQERLVSICKPDGVTIAFTYSENGDLDRILSSDETIDQPFESQELVLKQHDDQNRCVGFVLPDGSAASYCWDGDTLTSVYRLDKSGAILYELASDQFVLTEEAHFPKSRILDESKDPLFQLQSYGKRHYEYDVNGNIKKIISQNECLELRYDALDRLIAISNDEGVVWNYSYDGHNRRIERIVSNRDGEISHDYYLYDGTKEIGLMRNGEIIQFRLLDPRLESEIGATMMIELEDMIIRPYHDPHQNIRRLISIKGEELCCYRYDRWRERPLSDHELNCPWRYRGKRTDDESGLVFFGRRYYMPYEGRWLTPDPLGHSQEVNRYSYCRDKPDLYQDHYGLFSISQAVQSLSKNVFEVHEWVQSHFSFEHSIKKDADFMAHQLFSNAWLVMLGYYNEEAKVGVVGNGELNDKVRVTIINGMLNMHDWAEETALEVSKTHADINVHYVYRPTRGWMHDLIKATWCKFGFESYEAQLLAQTWSHLIAEMGGPGEGGTIVHYAHSIGAADTCAARLFLSPEEQRMIKVISLGSPLVIPHEGFGSVINYISLRDGIRYLALFAQKQNVVYLDSYWGIPVIDHLMNSGTYKTLMENLGKAFIKEYARQ